jgi:multicomponent Na+:H+ antiporter subunit F
MIGVDLALTGLAVAFALALVRAVRGPHVADRALAADLGFYTIVAAIALLALRTGFSEFLDVVLVAILLGFLATVALGALIGRSDS